MQFTRTKSFVRSTDFKIIRKFLWLPEVMHLTTNNDTRTVTHTYKWLQYVYGVCKGVDSYRITDWYGTARDAVTSLFEDYIIANNHYSDYRIKDSIRRLVELSPDNLIGPTYDIDNTYPELYNDMVVAFDKFKTTKET